ncbi:MAG: hypothetical protein J6A83_00070 [Clostridia bacterium]|nr:hypothetical protein [Clostridia bacterium]
MKRKLIALLSAILVLCTVLVSCGSISSVGKVINKDFDLTPELYKTAKDLAELKDYSFYDSLTSEEFALFYKLDIETVTTTYKVLSLRSGTVVGTFVSDKDTFRSFEFIEDTPAFLVSKAVINTNAIDVLTDDTKKAELLNIVTKVANGELDIDDDVIASLEGYIEMTYTLYDSTGVEVALSSRAKDSRAYADMIIFNGIAYDINEDAGTLVKAVEVPEYLDINECNAYNDEYFYMVNNNKLTVYDRSFNHKFTYIAPKHGDDSVEDGIYNYNILNNGDILLQYTLTQDEDAQRYDLSYVEDGVTYKSNLVSKLISVKNGKAKDIKLDYIVASIFTNNALYDNDKSENENIFTDKFDNIAIIYPIEDKKLMVSDADVDMVLMNNNAKAKKSLKMVDNQIASWATKIGDDKYLVRTLDGGATIIKSNGKVLNTMNRALEFCGDYFVGERAIYNLDLEKAYDLYENDAKVISTTNRAILIKETTESGYEVIKLLDGTSETVFTYTNGDKTAFYSEAYDNFYIIKDSDAQYYYYNELGENILVSKSKLASLAVSHEHTSVLLCSVTDEGSTYCILTKE